MQEDFNQLITWSEQFNFLPWRQERSLYKTLVSEIMLQQTTVSTVRHKFEIFITKYPSISELAKATEVEILMAWKGLGYYRRAKNLLAAAKYIATQYSAQIPCDYNQLIAIPGIGDYTARAILAIGAEHRNLAIDTNLERVIARYYALDNEKGLKLKNNILKLFENNDILNINVSFRMLNEALMDLGRTYCTNAKANCNPCPLQLGCQSKANPLTRPKVVIKNKPSYELSLLRILIIKNDNILCYKKNDTEWLAGQFECPTFIVNKYNDVNQYPEVLFPYKNLKSFKTNITKYKITNYILTLSLDDFKQQFSWGRELESISLLENNNISTATKKSLDCLNSRTM